MRNEGVVGGEDFQRGLIMMDVNNGSDGVPASAREAVEWFVENESDRELDEETVLQWEEWCTHVWNNAAYAEIVRMRLQIPLLPVPADVSRENLLRDVLAEDGPES
jgi:ferric-dicitrate binding protein FerR (iron transport regulator)